MGSESKPWLIWWAVAASAAVHAGAAAGVTAFSWALPNGDATLTSEMDFMVLDAPEDEVMPVPRSEPLPRLEPIPDDPAPPARLATLVPSGASMPTLEPTVVTPTIAPNADEEPDPEDERDRDRPRPLVSLDPAAVAAAAVIFEDEPPTNHVATDDGPSSREEALEEALGGALAAAGNARPHATRRPPPRLHPRRDGSYVFRGHVFEAVITADGEVRFADRGGVEMDAPSLSRPDGLLPSGSFDLSDSIERARGQDPYRHERRWFMEQTRELRERLADRAAERNRSRGMARLNGDLRRLWRGRGTAHERRVRIFRIWDDCAEDEVGQRARAAIVAFIRQTLPQGSPHAFTAEELSRLNRGRLSRAEFGPY